MDFDIENSIPGQKNFQIQGSSWIPATPIKPIVQRHQPIYANQQNNQLGNQNQERYECLSTGFSLDNQSQRIVSSFGCTNDLETKRYVGHWEAERIPISGNVSGGSQQVGDNPMAGWDNLRFVDLLAQFDMGSTSQAGSIASTSPCDFGYNIQTGSSWPGSVYGNSLATNQNQPLRSHPWADHTWVTPQRTHCELPVPCRKTYDLNVLPGVMADELPQINTLQFDPTTPNKRISQVIQNTTRDETIELHQDKTLSWADSSFPDDSSAITENQNKKNGCDQVIDLNATPQQKPRRRKHRPKVIREGKPKTVRKPALPKPDASKETPRVKRKYVRKNRLNKPSTPAPPEVAGEFTDPKPVEPATKVTRRSLNFEGDGQTRNEKSILNSANVDPKSHEQQQFCSGRVQSRELLHLNDFVSWYSRQAPSALSPSNINIKANTQLQKEEETVLISSKVLAPISPNDSNCSTTDDLDQGQTTAKRQSAHVCDMEDPSTVNIDGVEYNGMHLYEAFRVQDFNNRISAEIYKKRRTEKGQTSTTSSTSSSAITAKSIVQFARDNLQSIDAPQLQMNKAPRIQEEAVHVTAMHKVQVLESMQDLDTTERMTKKRSDAPTRVRDLASLIGTSHSNWLTTSPGNQVLLNGVRQGVNTSHGFQNCQEALVAENSASFTKGKRSKKPNSFISSISSSRNVMQMHQNNSICTQRKVLWHPTGPLPQVMWKHMLSVDAITEKLRQLNINMGGKIVSYQEYNALVQHQTQNAVVQYQPQNALVPYRRVRRRKEKNALVVYRRDGTVVPFDGSVYPTKKRIPRPKVDLDEETNKVWMLLLENINNEGINGTDEQKAKWWEEERRVFCGRADSFIARMHLVQGDRRFSKWKGSVVDSVVGVFLTQNVSDHLSSSAFMSMAAHFPLKSKSNEQEWYDEGTSTVVDEPELCVLELEDTIKTIPESLICDQSSMTLNDRDHKEETEGVNSIELLASSDNCISSNDDSRSKLEFFGRNLESFHESTIQHMDKETTYIVEDVISSQSSVDSSIAQTAEIRPQHFSERNPDAHDLTTELKSISFDDSPSFLELLNMAVGPNSKQVQEQRSCLGQLDGPESSIVAPNNHHSTLTTISRSQEVDCIEILDEDTRSSEFPNNNDEIRTSNGDAFTKETSNTTISQSNLRASVQEFPKVSMHNIQTTRNFTTNSNETKQPQGRPLEKPINVESFAQGNNNGFQQNKLPNFSGEISDVTESTNVFNTQKNTEHKEAERFLGEYTKGFVKPLNETNLDALGKRKRVVKEKKAAVDWDNLRKQAQANGVRQKTANTMDSVDWEAVRCVDVREIANTIKERGMNNLLAERIQAFLNRLVRDHESLDLEWLRDVPPDKAKEYLLSVRGLGLKSVECIRLLTLHHLAFPVDTNVGRIAVRLGWVPLQPLPESLQLHLLELYPVLESIQKYLWPRLCKLDQKTLYELHYQMITFGKVFCTKSKPNCNACPMRGECRHFASAFASARLALPGPEEKSIVTSTENIAAHDADIITNRLQLPPPPVNQRSIENNQSEALPPPPVNQHSIENGQSEVKSVMRNYEPIVEEPATPEHEYTQITESDIEDACCDDPDEIPTIKLNIEELTQNLQDYMQNNMELQEGDMSRALVALTQAATLPTPKLKNISRLRTEHQVYELPDSHPLLQGMDKREPDDPSSYLLAIWTPGETSNTIHQPEGRCTSQETGKLCSVATCFSCNSIREANSQTVRGTLLIPCRTAMRGSFPLNGTYFQVNEVFADHASSLCPIDVPRAWIWNLPRRTVYFGTSIPSIFKGLTTEGIQYCFWRGFVCVRGFDQLSRAPRPLIARLHFPASKLVKTKATTNEE